MNVKKPNGYWTKEKCHEEALKYKNRTEFYKKSSCAYTKSTSNGWIGDICSHMPKRKKRESKWTKELCKKEALKYDIKTHFHNNSNGAFAISLKNGWIDEICSHMRDGKKPNGYWTKEKCHKEALKYKSITDFQKKSSSAYGKASLKKWIDEICSHMEIKGNTYNRCIYCFEFSDNHVYVGLTYDINQRYKQHLKDVNSSVFKHIDKHNMIFEFKKLTEYIIIDDAIKMEKYYVNNYKDNGWMLLNKSKTGGLGGSKHKILKWDKEQCREEALKYNIKSIFKEKSSGAYHSARKNGWLDEVCDHMTSQQKPNGYWTKERCQEEALKYDTRKKFNINSKSAYNKAYNMGWLDDICVYMIEINKPKNYWTKEKCHEEALKYDTKKDFRKNSISAYSKSKSMKWLVELCSHMTDLKKPSNYWTYDICKKEASKFKNRTEFRNDLNGAYISSLKNNWLDEFFPKKLVKK